MQIVLAIYIYIYILTVICFVLCDQYYNIYLLGKIGGGSDNGEFSSSW